MSARSRKPDTESLGIESSSVLASSRLQTGVLPFFTTYIGPRTECAGFDGVICRTTRKLFWAIFWTLFCVVVLSRKFRVDELVCFSQPLVNVRVSVLYLRSH